jgi:hypothetical protein
VTERATIQRIAGQYRAETGADLATAKDAVEKLRG